MFEDLGLPSVHFPRVDFVRDQPGLLAGLGLLAARALTLRRALEMCERLAREVTTVVNLALRWPGPASEFRGHHTQLN
jgi:hypothetical protein